MRLSALNIWSRFKDRRAQQQREVAENSQHPKKVWDMRNHNSWGNTISWVSCGTANPKSQGKLCGHTTPLPFVGDEFISSMSSGRLGRFKLVDVTHCMDPSDMWFGKVEWMHYES